MEEFKLACRKMVDDNIKDEITEDVRELLTIAVMAIVLNKEELAYKRLPLILQRLNVFAENKSVLEIAHERLGNYSEDDTLSKADAAATRSLQVDDENKSIEEQLNLLVSLTDIEKKHTVNMVEKTVNGLIHFMRYGTIEDSVSSISIKDGISTVTYNKNTGRLRKKHFTLEGGITQYYTLQSLEKLYNFVENEDILDNPLLNKFKNEYKTYESSCYLVPVTVIELLCDDQHFAELLDCTFEERNGPSKVALYYNDVMQDVSAFSFLSHEIDCCDKAVGGGNNTSAISAIDTIKKEISRFKTGVKSYKKS